MSFDLTKSALDQLVGKRVVRIEMDADKTHIIFITHCCKIAYEACTQCCDESWFNHLSGVNVLIGNLVSGVEEIQKVEHPPTRQYVDWVYGYRITTPKGVATLELRNSSNGFYDGSVRVCNPSEIKVSLPVTEDF